MRPGSWGRAIDFVSQDDVRENRAGHEGHLSAFLGLVQNLHAGDVRRHEVRGELDALELEMEDAGDGFDQQRLGQAGSAGNQAMSAGKKRDEDLFDDFFLADDDFCQFVFDLRATGDEALDSLALSLMVGGHSFRGGRCYDCVHSVNSGSFTFHVSRERGYDGGRSVELVSSTFHVSRFIQLSEDRIGGAGGLSPCPKPPQFQAGVAARPVARGFFQRLQDVALGSVSAPPRA